MYAMVAIKTVLLDCVKARFQNCAQTPFEINESFLNGLDSKFRVVESFLRLLCNSYNGCSSSCLLFDAVLISLQLPKNCCHSFRGVPARQQQ